MADTLTIFMGLFFPRCVHIMLTLCPLRGGFAHTLSVGLLRYLGQIGFGRGLQPQRLSQPLQPP